MEWELYDLLHRIWRRELETEEIQSVPENLYERIREFIKASQEAIKSSQDSLERSLLEEELKVIRELTESLLKLRLEKILKALIDNKPVPQEVLTFEERDLVTIIRARLCALIAEILGVQAPPPSAPSPQQEEYVVVRFIKKCPEFVGIDSAVYGPFEPEDIARIPGDNAEALISRGIAVKIAT